MTSSASSACMGRVPSRALGFALLACALVLGGAGELAAQPFHGNLRIHVLTGGGAMVRTDAYSLSDSAGTPADWAGRWWVEDLNPPLAPFRDPLVAVAFETLPGGVRRSHFSVLRYDPGLDRFVPVQTAPVGPAGSEIYFLKIYAEGALFKMDLFEGLNPTVPLSVHHYHWDGLAFIEDAPGVALLPVDPDALPLADPAEMHFGAGPGIPFAVSTSASIPSASRYALIEQSFPLPGELTAEANPKGGTYATTVAVALASNSPTATLRYTTDGSDPVATSPTFVPGRFLHLQPCDPMTGACHSSKTLKFQATEPGKNPSPVVAETYTILQAKSADTDGDGLIDLWEAGRCVVDCRARGCCADPLPAGCPAPVEHCFDPLVSDAIVDCDSDGWSDFDEARLGSDAACGNSVPPLGTDSRRVRLSGTAALPDVSPFEAGSTVQTISPEGADLLPSGILPISTGAGGAFTDAATRGENDLFLAVSYRQNPRLVLHRFVPRFTWSPLLPSLSFGDADFTGAEDWFDKLTAALRYDVGVGGLAIDSRRSAMAQVLEHEVETLLPALALDYTGIPIGDVNRPPESCFPCASDGDLDTNSNGTLDRLQLILGKRGSGLTGQQSDYLANGTDLGLLGATLLEAAEDSNNPTYGGWATFAEDVFRAVANVSTFFGTTDEVLTQTLDGSGLPQDLADYIGGLPTLSREIAPEALPADLPGLVAAVDAAAHTTSAIYGRVSARGERDPYRVGDLYATGSLYRGIVADLVARRAGDLAALSDIRSGAEEAAKAVQEARLLAASGRPAAVSNLRSGISILAAALDAANGNTVSLAGLNARLNALVYRIDRAYGSPPALAQLETQALSGEFSLPDGTPPVVTATPAGSLFTGSVNVTLLADEPATIFYTLDGADPVPGAPGTLSATNQTPGILISSDTTLSWLGRDVPWLNTAGILRITYLQDTDADAIADAIDNCPLAANPNQENFDADAQGDACDPDDDNDSFADFADCRPLDPTLWAAPGESAITLSFGGATTLEWTSLAAAAGPVTRYDLARGPLADLHGAQPPGGEFNGAVCRQDSTPALSEPDAEVPLLGQGFYYLVRGDNACGLGSYDRSSSGAQRVVLACP